MIVTWMLGSIAFAALTALAAFAAERALVALGLPRRWPWLFALAAGTAWPVAAGLLFITRPRIVRLPAAVISAQTQGAARTLVAQLPALTPAWIDGIERALIGLWVVASLILLARLMIGIVRLSRLRAIGTERDVDGMRVLVTDSFGPAVYGAVNPRIVVPRWLLELDPALRSLVLAHEQQHQVRGDAAVIVAGAIAVALVPWNPAVWFMVRRVRLAVELDCDSRVLESVDDIQRYSKLLLLIAQRQTNTTLVPMLAESNTHLERRIRIMNSPMKSRSYVRGAAFGVATLAIVAVACSKKVMSDVTAPTPMSATKAAGLPANQQAYFEFQVEKPVSRAPGSVNPKYPSILKTAGVEGEVLAQYIVDETGLVMPGTFKVLRSTHALLVQAVKDALPDMRFVAAEIGGRRVKQLVQQPFVFAIATPGPSVEIIRADSGGAGGRGPRVLGTIVVPATPPVKKP